MHDKTIIKQQQRTITTQAAEIQAMRECILTAHRHLSNSKRDLAQARLRAFLRERNLL